MKSFTRSHVKVNLTMKGFAQLHIKDILCFNLDSIQDFLLNSHSLKQGHPLLSLLKFRLKLCMIATMIVDVSAIL